MCLPRLAQFVTGAHCDRLTTGIKAQGSIFEPFTGIFNALRLP